MKKLIQISIDILPYSLRLWIRHLPGIAALQRWLIQHFLAESPFVHIIKAGPATGLKFEVTLPLDKAVWASTYEPDFTAVIARTVKRGDVCYDIGGYRGYISGIMALAGAAKVLVFEPLPANQEALRRLCELNPNLPIELMRSAIGNVDGEVRLKVMADTSMGKLASSPFQVDVPSLASIGVPIHKIDTLVEKQGIPPPNIVKIDVEGAEVDVLEGAERVLKKFHPLIFLEAHSAALELACSKTLFQFGYKIHRLESIIGDDEDTRHLVCHSE